MKCLKYVIAGIILILISINFGFSLAVSANNQLSTVSEGQAASFTLNVFNNDYGQSVYVTADSDMPVSLSDTSFYLNYGQSRTVSVVAATNGLSGSHSIVIHVNDQAISLAVNVLEGSSVFILDSAYQTVSVNPGSYQNLKFVLRNEGSEWVKNIIVTGDIPKSFSPEYPGVTSLAPGEVREIRVKVTIPEDYPAGDREITVMAASGNLNLESTVMLRISDISFSKGNIDFSVLMPWNQLKDENNNVIGYNISMRVTNDGVSDITGLNFVFVGMPEDWTVSGNDVFALAGYETKDIVVEITPKTFSDTTVNITLMKSSAELASKKVVFAGSKVGMTGMFLFGGSMLYGVLIIIVLAIALFYFRSKNDEADVKEETKTKEYLSKLINKIKDDSKKDDKPPVITD